MKTLLGVIRDAIEQPSLTDALTMVIPLLGVTTPIEKSTFFIIDRFNKIRLNDIWWRSMDNSEKVDIIQRYVVYEMGSLYMEFYCEEKKRRTS